MKWRYFISVLNNYPVLRFSLLLILVATLASGEYRPKAYLRPEQCRRSEYFEVLSLSCVSCATLAEINFAANQSALLESSQTDRTTCSCQNGLQLVCDQCFKQIDCIIY